jgi:hypothetical protein
MMSTFFWIFFFVLQSQAGRIKREEDTFDFEVCPESHPYAFSQGQKCCSQQNLDETEFWISNACQADSIACPATKCEDLNEDCYPYLSVTGESDRGGIYNKIDFLEANRPIFKKEEGDSCVWWHQPYRHWWIGSCKNVGTNFGYAYLQEDGSCPSLPYPNNATWRKGGTDEIIDGLKASGDLLFQQTVGSGPPPSFSGTAGVNEGSDEAIIGLSAEALLTNSKNGFKQYFQTGSVEASSSGPTAGVNVIIREGKYKQSCRFVFRNGQFRCEEI